MIRSRFPRGGFTLFLIPEIFVLRQRICLFWATLALAHAGFGLEFCLAQDDYRIKEFKLEGVEQVSQAELREALATKSLSWANQLAPWKDAPLFNSYEFQLDLLRIPKFYRLQGFYRARVIDHKLDVDDGKQEIRVRVTIEENEPLRLAQISFVPADSNNLTHLWPDLHKALDLEVGDIAADGAISRNRLALFNRFADQGYPFAEITPQLHPAADNLTAKLIFKINPQKWCTFGKIEIQGQHYYPSRVIRKELSFKEGERFSQSKLLESQQRIYLLELFQSVQIRGVPVDEQSSAVPIEVRVREAPRYTLKLGGGFGTEDRFRTTVNWQRRNFLGDARRMQVEAKYSDLEPGRFQITLFQPHIPDAKTSLQFSPYYQRQVEKSRDEAGERRVVFDLRRAGAEALMRRRLGRYSSGYVRYRPERVEIAAMNDSTNGIRRTGRSTLTLGMSGNTSEPLFSPRRGYFRSLEVNWGNLFLKDKPYWRATAEYRTYTRLSQPVILATRMRIGSLFLPPEITEAEVPDELYYAGGSTSVRGWRRLRLGPIDNNDVPSGGRSILEGNLELRLPLWKSLGMVLFTDAGNVWRSSATFPLDDLHYAAGWGLRLDTPIGPGRIDFAWKLNRQVEAEKRFEFHLSIGQAF